MAFLLLNTVTAAAKDLNTLEITAATLAALPSCLHYRVIGICTMLVCDPVCHVMTTPRVSHYLPDAVVSVYNQEGENPWSEIRQTVDKLGETAGQSVVNLTSNVIMGTGEKTQNPDDRNHLKFKEADVIGNPALPLIYAMGFLLHSHARPLMPYFVSTADAASWRYGAAEMMYAGDMLPGRHEIGSFDNGWGSVYPRDGFINQLEDAKAASVIAFRAAHIVTREKQPHIYRYIDAGACEGDNCTEAYPLVENDEESAVWQMLSPIMEHSCEMFGKDNPPSFLQNENAYVWNLWRRYEGCALVSGQNLQTIVH